MEGLNRPTEVVKIIKRGTVVEGVICYVFGHLYVLDARNVSDRYGRGSDIESNGLEIHRCKVIKIRDESKHIWVCGWCAS